MASPGSDGTSLSSDGFFIHSTAGTFARKQLELNRPAVFSYVLFPAPRTRALFASSFDHVSPARTLTQLFKIQRSHFSLVTDFNTTHPFPRGFPSPAGDVLR